MIEGSGRILLKGRVSCGGLHILSKYGCSTRAEFYLCLAPKLGYQVFCYDKKLFERLKAEIFCNTRLHLEGELYCNMARPRVEVRLLMWDRL